MTNLSGYCTVQPDERHDPCSYAACACRCHYRYKAATNLFAHVELAHGRHPEGDIGVAELERLHDEAHAERDAAQYEWELRQQGHQVAPR